MCGIAGAWEFRGKVDQYALERMRDAMRHRGPDDHGLYIDPAGRMALGHRRLSIIDLSEGGHQPMRRGTMVSVFNGEIYNYQEIKRGLEAEGVEFTSNSDTEVLLRAFEHRGQEAVDLFRGMFAFAVWDEERQTLTLCRDRAGVKPLYYYHDGERFLFASEFSALARHPSVVREFDPSAAALFLRFGFIPAPGSIFKRIHKLEPGHFLTVRAGGEVTTTKYWDIAQAARKQPLQLEEPQLLDELERVLTEAFELRLISDVPVGVFLSGGIDSSLVAALLMKAPRRPLSTFTVGFNEERYDEAKYAKEIAAHLGTEHHEIYLSYDKAAQIIERLPEMFGEPFGGASAIPTFLVSEFARSKVTVALSADGGDELFCGYGDHYVNTARRFGTYAALPAAFGMLARTARTVAPVLFPDSPLRRSLLAAQGDPAATYALVGKRVFSDAQARALIQASVNPNFTARYWGQFSGLAGLEPGAQYQLFDFKTSFADNILAKVDRASMAVSLESREPFLDPKVMEFAASLPTALKHKGGESKYLLKQILYRYLPHEMVDRPKHGFSMPIRAFLAENSAYIETYLSDEALKHGRILNPEAVRNEKERFARGEGSPHRLWRILMLRMWEECWKL